MACSETTHIELNKLQDQLSLARSEIQNLRKEIKSLKYSQSKEISNIRSALEDWKCPLCQLPSDVQERRVVPEHGSSFEDVKNIKLQPVGFISTGFIRKRAVPRQPNINLSSNGKIVLHNSVFTNPEHSLEGLEGFSHMWILFYFHKNQSNHVRAKVAPPRLNGARIGVFGTRSPHRPCPIGLSLVQIDKIEGPCVYFSGVDMLDGTPVLDLKPYIPHYDNPAELSVEVDCYGMERLALDGQESEAESGGPSTFAVAGVGLPLPAERPVEREAPDGEEGHEEGASPHLSFIYRSVSPLPSHRHVRVPDWISQPIQPQLQVTFSPQAQNQLESIENEENLVRIITDILREDPRSVYLRDRYSNQFYTFLINDFHVSCKFDDTNHCVKVFRIIAAGTVCECGDLEWQCSIHGASETMH